MLSKPELMLPSHVTVIGRLWGGSIVDHQGKRSYNEWKGARQNIMSEINRLANKEDADLSKFEQQEARARRLFQQLDTDGAHVCNTSAEDCCSV